uniref:Uncharacterized protein n=1 Tax=Cebus imitator TaxID=2715852 RepID=A0A2K5QRZ3_CEBIM
CLTLSISGCAIITSLHFCRPSISPTGQDCIVVFLCRPTHQCKIWKIARTQSIAAKLMNTLLAYIYGAFLVPIKQFHHPHLTFPNEFCEKYGILHDSLVTWGFNSYLYFSCITRNNDSNYLSGQSLRFLFKAIVIVGEICKA